MTSLLNGALCVRNTVARFSKQPNFIYYKYIYSVIITSPDIYVKDEMMSTLEYLLLETDSVYFLEDGKMCLYSVAPEWRLFMP